MTSQTLMIFASLLALALPAATQSIEERVKVTTARPPLGNLEERVIRDFELLDNGYAASHRGIDIRAYLGEIIRSPVSGRIHFSGYVVNRPVISVIGPDGDLYAFEPACSAFETGERVLAGEAIAEVCAGSESYGHCLQTCLHISLRVAGQYLSPLTRFGLLKPSRLYPLSHLSGQAQALG